MRVAVEDLLDRIYEAALQGEQWPEVLAALAEMAGCAGGYIFNVAGPDTRFIASPEVAHVVPEYIAAEWPSRTDRPERIFRHPARRFIVDHDVYSADELALEPVYQEFLIPIGTGLGAAAGVSTPAGESIVVSVERRFSRGAVEPSALRTLDALRPHLFRAILLSSKLAFLPAVGRLDAFGSIGLPAAILGSQGRMLGVNDRMQALMPAVLADGPSGVHFTDPTAQRRLREALPRASTLQVTALPPIPVPALGQHPAHVAYILPVRGSAHDAVFGGRAILLLSPLASRPQPDAEVLADLFGLTPAEARVARRIAAGATVKQIADDLSVSLPTVRTQLRVVFEKTGARRQGDLAILLNGAALDVDDVRPA